MSETENKQRELGPATDLAGDPITICRDVIYRSRTGDYDVPAKITATCDTLNPKGVEAGNIPAITAEGNVHLTVFTPGIPNLRAAAEDFKVDPNPEHPISENLSGTYQEWDIPQAPELDVVAGASPTAVSPGTWRWPVRV